MQASAWTSRQHDPKCRDKSSLYIYCPSHGNSTNYFVVLGWQIKKIHLKQVKSLAIPLSSFSFSSSTGELRFQRVRGSVRQTGQMIPECVERSLFGLLHHSSMNTLNYICEVKVHPGKKPTIFVEYSQLCSWTNVHPIKNGFKMTANKKK